MCRHFHLLRPLCAAFVVCTAAAPARSADWYTGAETSRSDDDWIVAVDSALTVSSQGSAFAYLAVTGAPMGDLAQSGARVRVEGSFGRHGEIGPGGVAVDRDQTEGAALIGYEQVWQNATLGGFIGLNARSDDNAARLPGSTAGDVVAGVKAALQFYAKPTENTMVQAYGSYATSRNAYYGRVSGGYMLTPGTYVGPEIAVLGDDLFSQWRVGAHVTGMQLGSVQLGLSAGYLHDRVQKGGVYTTASIRAGF